MPGQYDFNLLYMENISSSQYENAVQSNFGGTHKFKYCKTLILTRLSIFTFYHILFDL